MKKKRFSLLQRKLMPSCGLRKRRAAPLHGRCVSGRTSCLTISQTNGVRRMESSKQQLLGCNNSDIIFIHICSYATLVLVQN